MVKAPRIIELKNQKHHRIIPSVYPPVNFFEDIVDPSEMETLYEIESMTNDRLRQEAGDIFLVPPEDRISGPGSTVVMAAFTHANKPSRFTDGSYGIYYAGLTLETAIHETVYNKEIFLKSTNEDPCEITMRVYEGKILHPLHDVRTPAFKDLHHHKNFSDSQIFAKEMRDKKSFGLIYNSVRHPGGTCIAAFKPRAVSIPHQTLHLIYHWNGERITTVSSTEILMQF